MWLDWGRIGVVGGGMWVDWGRHISKEKKEETGKRPVSTCSTLKKGFNGVVSKLLR